MLSKPDEELYNLLAIACGLGMFGQRPNVRHVNDRSQVCASLAEAPQDGPCNLHFCVPFPDLYLTVSIIESSDNLLPGIEKAPGNKTQWRKFQISAGLNLKGSTNMWL